MEEEEASEYSRSCSPESLASTGAGSMDPIEYYSDEDDDLRLDESLEQTIAGDLERLTDSGSTVNQLELEHQKTWREYVRVKDEGVKNLQALKKKLQSSIDKTEPFVQVWRRVRQLQDQAHSAAIKFERAHSEYESAKETLRIAEQGIADLEQERKNTRQDRAKSPVCQIDEAWQETLSNATDRVRKASQTRLESEIEHRRVTVEFQKCQEDYKTLENRLRKAIRKSRPFYEARFKCNQRLVEIKKRIQELDKRLSQHKTVYRSTMKHLESLNYLLHEHKERRRANSVMAVSSEPNLLERRARTPDFPLALQRMAITPDIQRKDISNTINFNFKGSTGSLPTVQPTKAAAGDISTCGSEQGQIDVRRIVSNSLSKALKRLAQDDHHDGGCSDKSSDSVSQVVRIEVHIEDEVNGDKTVPYEEQVAENTQENKQQSQAGKIQNGSGSSTCINENPSSVEKSDGVGSGDVRLKHNDISSNLVRNSGHNDIAVCNKGQPISNSVKLKAEHSPPFVPEQITNHSDVATPPGGDSPLLSSRLPITY